jgi:signal transduction histidine kinase/Tfp pilus assembly protein PilF
MDGNTIFTFMQSYWLSGNAKTMIIAFFAFCCCFLSVFWCQAQSTDTLMADLQRMEMKPGHEKDTAYLNLANELGYYLAETNPDSAFVFLDKQLKLCQQAKYRKGEAMSLKIYGNALQSKGDFKASLAYYNRSLAIAKAANEAEIIPGIINNIGLVHFNLGNYTEALNAFFEAIKGADKVNNGFVKAAVLNNIASIYFEQDKLDEAEQTYLKALEIDSASGDVRRVVLSYSNLGEVKLKQKKPEEALKSLKTGYAIALGLESPELIEMTSRTLAGIYVALDSAERAEIFFRESISLSKQNSYGVPYVKSLTGLSDLLYKKGNPKEAIGYAIEAKLQAEKMGQTILMRNANEVLSKIYEAEGNSAAALKTFKLFKQYNDSINDLRSQRVAATLEAEYKFSKKALQFEKESLRQWWLIFSAFAGLLTIGVILFIITRNRNRLNKAYHTLQEKKQEIEQKNVILEHTLGQLKETQLQLIHAEKMASLGELTAGIAHEIQNPLNFVNNFSELNTEIIDEIEAEAEKGNLIELKELLHDLKSNEQKINQHGKRADAIVKGMLAHSRTGVGAKKATDLNALAKEYLRLAYQGHKTRDPGFESDYHFRPAADLPLIEMIPQEIGRVLFNLMQNAFYAVMEHGKQGNPDYKPNVDVSLKREGDLVKVYIRDNGTGIPEANRSKIFQPFFTTRPTGQGTGLGLSLSYDVIKAHGGEILVESKEGEGSVFIISLPVVKAV